MNDKKADEIKRVYYDPSQGLSYKKTQAVLSDKYTADDIRYVLDKQPLYQSHRPTDLSHKHLRIVSQSPGQYQADLAFMDSSLSKSNRGYHVLLFLISVPTRRLFVYPLKNKNKASMTAAMESFLKESDPHVDSITSDAGSEFIALQSMLRTKGIPVYVTNKTDNANSHATAIVDRVIRTVREMLVSYMDSHTTYKWIDALDDIVANYNSSKHSSLGKAPRDMGREDVAEHELRLRQENEPRYQELEGIDTGSMVRVLTKSSKLTKGPRFKWSARVHTVKGVAGNHIEVEGMKRPYFLHEIQLVEGLDVPKKRNTRSRTTEVKNKEVEDQRKKINRGLAREGLDLRV